MISRRVSLLLFAIFSAFFASKTVAQTKLLRFPDIHGDEVVFTYGGDLWTAPVAGGTAVRLTSHPGIVAGGTAVRLTSHPGIEVFAKFSPDGKWIAFTGQYDGDEQVYVMPAAGGVPKQLTFYPARGPLTPRWGYDNQVYGWSDDGRYVIFRSLRDSYALPISRLYRVSVEGGPAEALPMPESGAGTFSPDGKKMVYSPRSRDFRTEKRYSGGQANQLYIFDLGTFETKKITDSERASRDPMWISDRIFFNSDRDFGSRRPLQFVCLRRPGRENYTGHFRKDLGYPLAELRPQEPHCLRTGRRAAHLRRRLWQESQNLDYSAG